MKNSLETSINNSNLLFNTGRRKEAFGLILRLIKKHPDVRKLRVIFSQMACDAGVDIPCNPNVSRELAYCLDHNVGDARRLLLASGALLSKDATFINGITLLGLRDIEANYQALQQGQLRPITHNILLHSLLRNLLLTNREYDLAMSQLRRLLLYTLANEDKPWEPSKNIASKFCSSLATQCQLNEYVYICDTMESEQIEKLKVAIETSLINKEKIDERTELAFLVFAMYRPLQSLAIDPSLWKRLRKFCPKTTATHIDEIDNWLYEQSIITRIETLTTIEDETSNAIREHYEENPYPRWINLPDRRRMSFRNWLGETAPHFDAPQEFQNPIRLFVAGCGTGLEAISATTTWDTDQVLAVDLSKSSLAYAIRKSGELGLLDKIDFKQADILRLGILPGDYRNFDVITSSGVLHHLRDPMAGFRILLELLAPNGIFRFALYSELARRHVVKARKYILENKIEPNPDGIRNLRNKILRLKLPELNELPKNPDMYSLSTCRDLLFHAQETRYTLPKIEQLLAELDLEFIAFEGIENAKRIYRIKYRDDAQMTNLANWAKFEEEHPDTFESMYAIIARKRQERAQIKKH